MKKDKLPSNVSYYEKNETIFSSSIENLRDSTFKLRWEI
jgi:hypothetical protein